MERFMVGKVNTKSLVYECLDPDYIVYVPDDNFGLYACDEVFPGSVLPHDYRTYFHDIIMLLQNNGYKPGINLFGFPFDWRQDLSLHSTQQNLLNRIEQAYQACGQQQVTVLTHSLGGQLFRLFLQLHPEFSSQRINRWIALACPFLGAARHLKEFLSGYALGMPEFIMKERSMWNVATTAFGMYWFVQPENVPFSPKLGIRVEIDDDSSDTREEEDKKDKEVKGEGFKGAGKKSLNEESQTEAFDKDKFLAECKEGEANISDLAASASAATPSADGNDNTNISQSPSSNQLPTTSSPISLSSDSAVHNTDAKEDPKQSSDNKKSTEQDNKAAASSAAVVAAEEATASKKGKRKRHKKTKFTDYLWFSYHVDKNGFCWDLDAQEDNSAGIDPNEVFQFIPEPPHHSPLLDADEDVLRERDNCSEDAAAANAAFLDAYENEANKISLSPSNYDANSSPSSAFPVSASGLPSLPPSSSSTSTSLLSTLINPSISKPTASFTSNDQSSSFNETAHHTPHHSELPSSQPSCSPRHHAGIMSTLSSATPQCNQSPFSSSSSPSDHSQLSTAVSLSNVSPQLAQALQHHNSNHQKNASQSQSNTQSQSQPQSQQNKQQQGDVMQLAQLPDSAKVLADSRLALEYGPISALRFQPRSPIVAVENSVDLHQYPQHIRSSPLVLSPQPTLPLNELFSDHGTTPTHTSSSSSSSPSSSTSSYSPSSSSPSTQSTSSSSSSSSPSTSSDAVLTPMSHLSYVSSPAFAVSPLHTTFLPGFPLPEPSSFHTVLHSSSKQHKLSEKKREKRAKPLWSNESQNIDGSNTIPSSSASSLATAQEQQQQSQQQQVQGNQQGQEQQQNQQQYQSQQQLQQQQQLPYPQSESNSVPQILTDSSNDVVFPASGVKLHSDLVRSASSSAYSTPSSIHSIGYTPEHSVSPCSNASFASYFNAKSSPLLFMRPYQHAQKKTIGMNHSVNGGNGQNNESTLQTSTDVSLKEKSVQTSFGQSLLSLNALSDKDLMEYAEEKAEDEGDDAEDESESESESESEDEDEEDEEEESRDSNRCQTSLTQSSNESSNSLLRSLSPRYDSLHVSTPTAISPFSRSNSSSSPSFTSSPTIFRSTAEESSSTFSAASTEVSSHYVNPQTMASQSAASSSASASVSPGSLFPAVSYAPISTSTVTSTSTSTSNLTSASSSASYSIASSGSGAAAAAAAAISPSHQHQPSAAEEDRTKSFVIRSVERVDSFAGVTNSAHTVCLDQENRDKNEKKDKKKKAKDSENDSKKMKKSEKEKEKEKEQLAKAAKNAMSLFFCAPSNVVDSSLWRPTQYEQNLMELFLFLHRPINREIWTPPITFQAIQQHIRYFSSLPLNLDSMGIKLFNIFASGNGTAWHCLVDVRKKDIRKEKRRQEKERRKAEKMKVKEEKKAKAGSEKEGDSEVAVNANANTNAEDNKLFDKDGRLEGEEYKSFSSFTSHPAFAQLTPRVIRNAKQYWTEIDGDTTVPCFSGANDRLGAVARFEIKGSNHTRILWDKRTMNLLCAILDLPMPYPNYR
eukprot:MONOS_460.1-p1 / transcript=MONOS_460.1 / gene=MONOS_460 / organism=Monocercomonoides_exilis_PA203 / gene_product=phosphatidylcholine-sterol O-acyltransferase, putative / transcript_product=phosphatidylcholine-sterol O-acyltransferase, putative / location=Mono_scaffold00007:171675-176430(+) / protein_length=1540 / sequence_SO=supercontig / SO=protein_coding / is_pseudo=false